ncbi:MAG: phospholipid carrier-dependent glycosyltransferase [Defluviitaleaceae bacterium]|nr:phospholipid carrier-dependent glycosyltransferase [Defluviitaleaceae bacterium]
MKNSGLMKKAGETYFIWMLLLAGFIVRYFAFGLDFGFENDIRTFQLWAIRVFEVGFAEFYSVDVFSDYPPVYMYVLFVIGAVRAAIGAGLDNQIFRFLIFLPAILADLGIGYVIYKIANKSLLFAALWIFNPAIILISGVWGQIESVFVLMLLVSLLLLRQKKLLPAYVLFGIAILTKPQSLFLAPVYLYSAYEGAKSPKYVALSIGAGIFTMLLVSLPFGLSATADTLWYGMDSYNFLTVNAFNFWALIGGNWQALGAWHTSVGVIIVLVIIAAALGALHINKTRHGGKHFFLIVAALFIVIFAFSVKMHERYLFPALLFLLMYYIENRERREFILYWAFSAVFFINCLEILRWANAGYDWVMLGNSSIYVISFIVVFLAVSTVFIVVKSFLPKSPGSLPMDSPKHPPPMRKRDFAYIAALIIVYSVLAFTNLGDMRTPQTTWVSSEEVAYFDFGEAVHVSQFQFLMGARHNIPFGLHSSVDGQEWELLYHSSGGDVFAWAFVELDTHAQFVAIGANEGLRLQEIAFRGVGGELLEFAHVSPGAEALVDEQHLVPTRRYFMNSTYFDEIYHPRTGYEFVHGLTVYETTHPPLGKVFMAASIRAFGMTPFAWRLPGTLFGILLIPLIYAFARLLLKSNNYALFASFIFTFDFMLFSHTRLATIDTFVTFFVIAMYFFMYCYIENVEKNSLARSLAFLALCGAATGLAVASKWQGVYAAIGLPFLFFPALYKVYLRDRRQAIITFVACFGFFIALPILIYVLSYIPFVLASGGGGLRTIWENQQLMLSYHSIYVLGAQHRFASPWWSWPLMITPLWQYQTIISDTMRGGMSSMGNPGVWWFGIFATGFAIFSLAKKRRFESDTAFLLVAYAANFLPWIFVTRLTFIYHYFPAVPFVVLLIAMFFKHFVKRDYLCFAYAGVVLALFILFYPVLSGMPVNIDFVDIRLRWFPDWFFV